MLPNFKVLQYFINLILQITASEIMKKSLNTWRIRRETRLLTRPRCTRARRGTLPFDGGRWRRWGTGTPAGSPCRRGCGRTSPRSAIPGSRRCRCRLRWSGYIWPRCGTDSGYCSGAPRSHFHSLDREDHVGCKTVRVQKEVHLQMK